MDIKKGMKFRYTKKYQGEIGEISDIDGDHIWLLLHGVVQGYVHRNNLFYWIEPLSKLEKAML